MFANWLIKISKNIEIDKICKKNAMIYRNTATTSEEHIKRIADDAPTAEDILISEQHLAELQEDITQLKPHYKEIINLRYFQEISYNEISSTIGEPLNNVKVRLLRAKKLLAEILEQNRNS